MNTVILYIILGLASGAAYAILALGIVLIHRGSGTINFAQGAIGMFSALFFNELIEHGNSKGVSVVVVVGLAAVLGAAWHFVVMRPLRGAPVLARVVATLGLLSLLEGGAIVHYGTKIRTSPSLLPKKLIHFNGIAFGVDRLWLFGITVVIAVILWAWYRYTIFGISTRAASENERAASLLGYSPDLIAGANWAIGCALAAISGILIAPIVGLDITALTLVVLPGLAAALFGRFSLFGVTALAGIVIGSGQSLLSNYWTQIGVSDALPFVLVIIAMILAGRSIPARGTLSTKRQPLAPRRTIGWRSGGLLIAFALLGAFMLDNLYKSALATSLIAIGAALSVVVVTGFVGQTSLMPMTFAGLGGMLTSKFAQHFGLPFPLPIIVAALLMVPIGAVLGLPALRVRGLNLAVITLGAAVAVTDVLFNNTEWTGNLNGDTVPSPKIFGFSLDATLHPTRFAILCLVIAALLIWAVGNVRRSPSGLRMLAVRSN
jgi:branched-chain amino acid transport system permease protein